MKTLVTIFCLALAQLVSAQEYSEALRAAKMDLDSAWAQTTIPSTDEICLPQSDHLLRKKQLSNHDCLEVAIKTATEQGAEAAMPWLLASQCYNPPGRDRVNKAGADAVRYVMNMWGGGQGKIAGFDTPEVLAEGPIVTNYSFTNQTGEVVFFYTIDTTIADGRVGCSDYKYQGMLQVNRSYNTPVAKGRYLWIRFSKSRNNNGCDDIVKTYNVGPKSDQSVILTEQLPIR